MKQLIFPGNLRTPLRNTRLNYRSPIVSRGLLYAWRMDDAVTGVCQDAFRRGRNITLNSVAGVTNFKGRAPAYQFNGTSSYASVAVDLSTAFTLSVSFWLRVDTYNTADDLAMELTSNFNSFVTGFIIDPCSSTGAFSCNHRGNGGYNDGRFTRPSAGDWHFYTVIFDHTAAGADEIAAYCDGVLQSLTKTNSADNPSSDPFANDTLYIMTRTISSLYLHGSICNLLIHNRALTLAEHNAMYLDPYWSWLERAPIILGKAASGGSVAADGSLAASSTVTGNAIVTYAGTGTVGAAASVSGNAIISLAGTGTIAASATVIGNAALALPVIGTIAAVATVGGNAGLSLTVTGSASPASTVAGNAIAAWAASGTIAGVATVGGNATVEGGDEASGSISATSTVSGNAGMGVPATGAIAATSTVGGNASLALPVTGSSAAVATVSGNVAITRGVSGSISTQSTVTGNVILAISASGSSAANGICVANSIVLWQVNGLVVALCVVNGNAQVVTSGNVPGLLNVFTESREIQWLESELAMIFTELERTM